MRLINNHTQRGQALVLVALAMIAMLAMLGLVLDGGNTFMNRRAMQNAADAGALAGARQLCLTRSQTDAEFVANQYATYWNSAQAAAVDADLDARTVVVTATKEVNTFFAHFINRDRIRAQAVAEAGCYNPTSGVGVLPVAWSCRAPIRGNDPEDPQDCDGDYLTETELDYVLAHDISPDIYDELYIIMDDITVPDELYRICLSQGGYLDCDLDDDGSDDLLSNGGRSWLNLDGGPGGASEMRDWILGNANPTVASHTWLAGKTGVAGTVFQAVGDVAGRIVAVPVFDQICDSDDIINRCVTHPEDIYRIGSGGGLNFHVITFALFYISCVNSPGVPGAECPGHKWLRDNGILAAASGVNASNPKTIEGYFIEGTVEGLSGDPSDPGGVDVGSYVFYLTR